MRTIARWVFVAAAAILLVPVAQATVMVVDVDGTSYSVEVVPVAGGDPDDSSALALTIETASGIETYSLIAPTEDAGADRDPTLMLVPGTLGPTLIWSRRNGRFDQIAFSRLENLGWTPVRYLSNSPRHHVRPQAGVDAFGNGYVVWAESGGNGSVMLATFDPLTGNLLSSPRDLMRELVRSSPPEWLTPEVGPSPPGRTHGRGPVDPPDALPEGGNDVPNVPPATGHHSEIPVNGSVGLSPNCPRVVAAVVRNRALAIGVLQHGTVLEYYRSVIPVGAPEAYLPSLLQSLLNQHCN